jgi:uncharacterized protein (PEP-CTERM system associated)
MARARRGAHRFHPLLAIRDARRRAWLCLAALALAQGGAAWANKTEVAPFLALTQTYTDNVSLAPEGATISDSITQVVPGISVTSTGPRLRLSARYAPEIIYYSKLDPEDTVFHRGHVTGNVVLARELLYVDAGAKVDQYEISLRGPIYDSNVNAAGNRATTRTSYITPYLQKDFDTGARAEARLTLSTLRADDPAIADNDAGRAILRLGSGPAPRRLNWDLSYEREAIEYEVGQESRSERAVAGARLLVVPSVGLLARTGRERYDSGIAGSEIEGDLWSAGLEWTPTARTRLVATAGKRFDDDAYSLEFRHRTRLTSWGATYNEDVTSSRSELFLPITSDTATALDPLFSARYPDPVARQKAIQEFIAQNGLPPSLGAPANFFSQELFLQKRWLASVAINGVRNTLIASFFSETRKALFSSLGLPASGDFATSDSIRLTGGGVSWSWRLSPRLAWNLDVSVSRHEFLDTDQFDDYATVRMGLTRQIQRKFSGTLSYRRQEKESVQDLNSYVENAYIASLRMTF